MHIKPILGAVLSAVLLCVTPAIRTTAEASEPYSIVAPLYEIANDTRSVLTVNGTSVTCKSIAESGSAVKITAEQTLQKQGFLWSWGTYDGAKWTKTVYSNTLAMSNTKTGLSSGKYRLKTVFTLTDKNGKSETITVYSAEKSVG